MAVDHSPRTVAHFASMLADNGPPSPRNPCDSPRSASYKVWCAGQLALAATFPGMHDDRPVSVSDTSSEAHPVVPQPVAASGESSSELGLALSPSRSPGLSELSDLDVTPSDSGNDGFGSETHLTQALTLKPSSLNPSPLPTKAGQSPPNLNPKPKTSLDDR